jgi:small subunit ribosomal protein S21
MRRAAAHPPYNIKRKEEVYMPRIEVRKDEPIDKALRKFKTKVRREGIIEELKKREFYEKPSERRRKNLARAVRREQRRRLEEE